jgi:site-specific DNA-methyltransferase (adenine-specific)
MPQLEQGDVLIEQRDALEAMRELPDQSFDLAICDPPYGAASKHVWSLPAGHELPGFGGAWNLAAHEWDMIGGAASFRFTLAWLSDVRRLVKPTGSIWIHGTYHNAGIANVACQMLQLEIIYEVVWFKRNAFPNLAKRRLTASHETLLWVHTGGSRREYRFNYDDVKAAGFPYDGLKEPGKQMRTVWDIPNNKSREERAFGSHPTQKPLRLIERLLLVSGVRGGRVVIPFLGSGTDAVAAIRWGMAPTGFETDPEYFEIALRRVREETMAFFGEGLVQRSAAVET